MAMIKRKLTINGRTTIPQRVRAALLLRPGDELVYQIDGERVILTKAGIRPEGAFRSFSEWSMEADAKAYYNL